VGTASAQAERSSRSSSGSRRSRRPRLQTPPLPIQGSASWRARDDGLSKLVACKRVKPRLVHLNPKGMSQFELTDKGCSHFRPVSRAKPWRTPHDIHCMGATLSALLTSTSSRNTL